MSINTIKGLIKNGDIPQASEQLREILAKTPEDAVARMLYGTCRHDLFAHADTDGESVLRPAARGRRLHLRNYGVDLKST